MSTTPNSGNNSWLGKFLKFDKSRGDGDSQKTAVVDVHIRFSLSEPKSLADAVSRLAPPWFKLLKRVQPVLPLLQSKFYSFMLLLTSHGLLSSCNEVVWSFKGVIATLC